MADNPAAPAATDQFFLGQIDANLKQLLEARHRDKDDFRAEFRSIHERIDQTSARITTLERGSWKIAGIAATVTAAPLAVVIIGYVIKITGQ